ncbi:MAG: LacI family DNA-binding transcriptional regulator [Phaeodactylibacter sp.]|uniref:LacI family DNA-binding transcriptional regulator n=1 Tax=Phaeodactylibacter sp. TaxID=1940289 RepID=UPI0032EF904F
MKKKTRINIYDVAAEVGVSISTVSRALNDDARISPKTKAKVKAAAMKLGFQKNALATSLSTNQTKVIGVIVPQLNREFLSSLVHNIEEAAFEKGYSVIVCQTNNSYEREKTYMDTLIASRVAGIVATLSLETESFEHFEKAREQGIKVVLVDRVTTSLKGTTKIVIDDYRTAFEGTRHLIDQGYTQIAYVSGPTKQLLYADRLRGFQQAMKEAGLPVKQEWIKYGSNLSFADGTRIADELLKLKERPNAIFTANNLTAISTIAHAEELGIKVPEQLGVIGFSEEPFSAFMKPSVTSIRQPSKAMGQLAVQKLIEEINSDQNGSYIHQKVVLDTELICRDSTRLRKSG